MTVASEKIVPDYRSLTKSYDKKQLNHIQKDINLAQEEILRKLEEARELQSWVDKQEAEKAKRQRMGPTEDNGESSDLEEVKTIVFDD